MSHLGNKTERLFFLVVSNSRLRAINEPAQPLRISEKGLSEVPVVFQVGWVVSYLSGCQASSAIFQGKHHLPPFSI